MFTYRIEDGRPEYPGSVYVVTHIERDNPVDIGKIEGLDAARRFCRIADPKLKWKRKLLR